jgi:uncharacterized glyoxalase superfamily protein PhnB
MTSSTTTTNSSPTTATSPGVWPTLSYRDAEAAVGYLVDVVGFTIAVVHRSADRPVAHAELRWPDGGGIMFGSDQGEQRWSGAAGAPGTATAYLSTDDVAGVASRVTEAGWQVLRPLAETDYGATEFAFLDPEGNAWSVGTYRGEG